MWNNFFPSRLRVFAVYFFLFFFKPHSHAQNADIRWLRDINLPANSGLDHAMKFTSQSVAPTIVAVPVGFFVYGLIAKDETGERNAAIMAASLLSTNILEFGLKISVKRPRPFVTYPDIIKRDNVGPYSFPSAHTGNAFALATSLALCYPKWYVIAPAFTWAFAVGYSRMRLGVHYPSDVFTGACLGAGCAWGMWYLNKKLVTK